MLLEEFEDVPAVIEPTDRQIRGAGQICSTIILTFNGEIIQRLKEAGQLEEAGYLKNINGKFPWYLYQTASQTVAVMLAPVGAPMMVGQLEELAARGFENFIVLGSCGVLVDSLESDKIILPVSALRDEGTSYHYAPASDEIAYHDSLIERLEGIFDQHDIPHTRAKTWTTDAFYRETPAKVKRRLRAGAQVVDMEAAAIMSWSQYRQTKVYQFFYTADYVNHEQISWDNRYEERTADVLTFWDIALIIAEEIRND